MGTGSTCPRSCTVERERAEGSRSFRANELRKLPYHQGHNRFRNLRSRPHTLREPQTTWCRNREQHAGKFAPMAARSRRRLAPPPTPRRGEPQTTWCRNREQHAGKFAPMAARSAAGQSRGQDAQLQIYRRTSHAARLLHRNAKMNGDTSITAAVAHLLTPAERQHWKLAWLSTVDHKRIGILYMLAGLGFF